MESDNKKWWQSKTIWVNAAIAAAGAVFQDVAATLDPEIVAAGVAIVNILLRFGTKKAVKP